MKNLFAAFLFLLSIKLVAQPGKVDPSFKFFQFFNKTIYQTIVLPNGKILAVGDFTNYAKIKINRIARINADGTLDSSFQTGTGADAVIRSVSVQQDGKILIAGDFTKFNGNFRRGVLRLNDDGSFDPTFSASIGSNQTVRSVKVLNNGKIFIVGNFNTYIIKKLNADGTQDNSFNPAVIGDTGYDMVVQSDGKIVVSGIFGVYNGMTLYSHNLVRLNVNGSLDLTFALNESVGNPIENIAIQQDDKILAGGHFISTSYNFVRLNLNGAIETTFPTNIKGTIYDIVVQPDNKILVGGNFSLDNGSNYINMIRMNQFGTLDNTFNNQIIYSHSKTGSNVGVYGITLTSDNTIIVAGNFDRVGGSVRNYIGKLNSNGDLAADFYPSGTNEGIVKIVPQKDGKLLVLHGGTAYNHLTRNKIVRVNPDGTIDESFNANLTKDDKALNAVVQSDNKIVISGIFPANPVSSRYIIRVNSDGSPDPTFVTGTFSPIYSSLKIAGVANNKIIVAGEFTSFNGANVNGIVRLNADGSIDNTFNYNGSNTPYVGFIFPQNDGTIYFTKNDLNNAIRLGKLSANGTEDLNFKSPDFSYHNAAGVKTLAGGKLLFVGDYNTVDGVTCGGIVRLNPDGSLDNSFNMSAQPVNNSISTFDVQKDGKILIGGIFTIYYGMDKPSIARLNADGSMDPSFVTPDLKRPDYYQAFTESILLHPNGKIYAGGNYAYCDSISISNIIILQGDIPLKNYIKGNIYNDVNHDCMKQSGEFPISTIIKAEPGPWYGMSDAFGNYVIEVDTGNKSYSVSQEFNPLQKQFILPICPTDKIQVNTTGINNTSCCNNFADAKKDCHLLSVSVESDRRRRCFRSHTIVNYKNEGTKSAPNGMLTVVYPEYMRPIFSAPAWTSIQGNIITYNLGDINPGKNFNIMITDSVVCGIEEIRGLTQCVKATITPTNDCEVTSTSWDMSSIEVSGQCVNNVVKFVVKNSGLANMKDSSSYRIFLNDTLVYNHKFKLNQNTSVTIEVPAGGKTARLEADQVPDHPGNSNPVAIIEACGGIKFQGHVTTLAQDNKDPETALSCMTIIDSFDPNDKQATPIGYGSDHKIKSTDRLDYTIRFQNTGTDTAYNVVLEDTLDTNLDVSTLVTGVGSHIYSYSISGNGKPVLKFTFGLLYLPPASQDSLRSIGFVKYSIAPKSDVAEGMLINNKAYIYFDYNSPVITNNVFHTISNEIPVDLSKNPGITQKDGLVSGVVSSNLIRFTMSPNPVSDVIKISIETISYYDIKVYTLNGIKKMDKNYFGNTFNVSVKDFEKGIYFIELVDADGNVMRSKFVKE